MKSIFQATLISALLALTSGCVEEGNSSNCGEGGRGNWEQQDGCLTPVGGSCLTEAEFKEGRPQEREVQVGEDEFQTITIDEDWESYQDERPECDFSEDE